MMTGKQSRVRAASIAAVLLAVATWAAAGPAAAGASAPAAGASGAGRDVCADRPNICRALHVANKALIEAARANRNRKDKTVCTSLQHDPGCGTTQPQPYLTARDPYGNPADVESGMRLLEWYLKDVNCESLCRAKSDVQGCVAACGTGHDPRSYPNGPTQPASGASAPSP